MLLSLKEYSLTNSVSAYTTELSVQWQIFGLSLSVNPGVTVLANRR